MNAQIKNWKTTTAGILLGALVVMQELTTEEGLQWNDPQLWIGVGIAILGILTRDADKSSQDSGVRAIALLLAAGCLLLPSCADYPVTGSVYYRDPSSGAKGGMTFTPGEDPVIYGKMPLYDEATGELIGMVDISTEIAVARAAK